MDTFTIYYDYSHNELITADETRTRAIETIENNNLHIEKLESLTLHTVWTMLKPEYQEQILDELIQDTLRDDFSYRTFELTEVEQRKLDNLCR